MFLRLPRVRATRAIFFLFQLLLVGVVRLELLPVPMYGVYRHGAGQFQSNKTSECHQVEHPVSSYSPEMADLARKQARQKTAACAPVFDVHAVATVAPAALPGPRLLGRLCQILLLLLLLLDLFKRTLVPCVRSLFRRCSRVGIAARGGCSSLRAPCLGLQEGQLSLSGLEMEGRPTARAGRSPTSKAADARHPVD